VLKERKQKMKFLIAMAAVLLGVMIFWSVAPIIVFLYLALFY